MNDKKNFKYEAKDPVVVNKKTTEECGFEVNDVQFLVSAVVDVSFGDLPPVKKEVSIDIANRKVYHAGKEAPFCNAVFDYLDRANTLPEDFFQADENIYKEANKAVDDMEDMKNTNLKEGE